MKTSLLSILALGLFTIAACSDTSDETSDETSNNDSRKGEETESANKKTDNELPTEKGIAYGIDISKYQGDEMDVMEKSEDSLEFVICRSTEGITYIDPKFHSNWKEIKEKGFIRGAYHFYRSGDDPNAQAENFLQTVGYFEPTDFPPIIDFEEASIVSKANKHQVIIDLLSFIQIIEDKTGRTPMIYTDINIGNSYLSDEKFAKYPLWIADYSSKTQPRIPGAWKGSEWVMWQKSSDYLFDNIRNDFDVFNGSVEGLKAFISSTTK